MRSESSIAWDMCFMGITEWSSGQDSVWSDKWRLKSRNIHLRLDCFMEPLPRCKEYKVKFISDVNVIALYYDASSTPVTAPNQSDTSCLRKRRLDVTQTGCDAVNEKFLNTFYLIGRGTVIRYQLHRWGHINFPQTTHYNFNDIYISYQSMGSFKTTDTQLLNQYNIKKN